MSDWKIIEKKLPASHGWIVTETRYIPHRTNLLHRRPAKWWRHPKAWTTIRGKHWGKSLRSYIVAVAMDHRQNERRWKNATN